MWFDVPDVTGPVDVDSIQRAVEERWAVQFQDVVLAGAEVPQLEFEEKSRTAVRVRMPGLSTEAERRRRELEFNGM